MKPRFLYFYHDEDGEIKGISPLINDNQFKDYGYQKIPFDIGQPFLIGKRLLHQWYFTVNLPKVRLIEKSVSPDSVSSMFALNEVDIENINGKVYITKKNDPTILYGVVEKEEELIYNEEYSYYEEDNLK